MDPWAIIEKVKIPCYDSKLTLYFYHMYGNEFHMNNHLVITIESQMKDKIITRDLMRNAEEIYRKKWRGTK